MKKYSYLIIIVLISSLVLTGCSLLSNIGQVPTSQQSGIAYLTKGLSSGLVGLWSFEEGEDPTIAYDSSGNNNDGTIYGGAIYNPDQWGGQALSFDGIDDYVKVLDLSTLEPTTITVETWVKNFGNPGIFKYIISKVYDAKLGSYSSYAFYTGGSGGLRFYIGSASASWVGSPDAGAILWDGNWHHIAGTYDGSMVRLFVDGEEVGMGTSATPTIAYDGGNLYIGYYGPYAYPTYFPGLIDEVRIYDYVLSPSMIAEHAEGIYGFNGLLAPYAPPGQKTFKFGRTIPLKWQYTDFGSNAVESAGAKPEVKYQFDGEGNGDGELVFTEDPGLSGYHYNIDTKTWQFNWQTKGLEEGIGTYKIWITSIQTGQVNGPFLIELR